MCAKLATGKKSELRENSQLRFQILTKLQDQDSAMKSQSPKSKEY